MIFVTIYLEDILPLNGCNTPNAMIQTVGKDLAEADQGRRPILIGRSIPEAAAYAFAALAVHDSPTGPSTGKWP